MLADFQPDSKSSR